MVREEQPRFEGLEGRVLLATFKVNTTLDTQAVNLRNGKDATGHISLRSAIMAADSANTSLSRRTLSARPGVLGS